VQEKMEKADQLPRLIGFISRLPLREFLLSPLFGEARRVRVRLSNKPDEFGTICDLRRLHDA
jgi:hypothetical protein